MRRRICPDSGRFAAVTGATGHIGNVLVRELTERGDRVRAVIPEAESPEPIAGLGAELYRADVRDRAAIRQALEGAEAVFHLAGIISIAPGRRKVLEQVNVTGTENVVRSCLENGVKRMVYVSSVHALAEPEPGVAVCEQTEFRPEGLLGDYARSKARATIEVLRGVARGLDAVIAFPSGVIGPHDYRLSEMGRLLLDFCCGRLRAYVDGEYNFVDVRDVARGLILAMERGRSGEGYLLSGNRVSIPGLMRLLENVTGVRAPQFRAPMWLARAAALVAPLWCRFKRTRPRFTSYSLRVLRSNCLMDPGKAMCELGYTIRPVRETIEASIAWFRRTGRLETCPRAG